MPLHMRTSVELPDALLQQARELARARKTTLRALLLDGLRTVIERHQQSRRSYRLADCSYGEGGLVDELAPTDWDAIRDRSYEGRGS